MAVVVIALAVIYTYRGKFSMIMKKGDAEVSITGENVDTTAASSPANSQQQPSLGNNPNNPPVSAAGNIATASGDGAVAIGGDAPDATITTTSSKPKKSS